MGLLDQVVGAVAGQLGGGQGGGNNMLMQLVMQLIKNQPGGLQGLVEQFTKAGLGQQVQSWIGTGANLPVSADDISKVFGGTGGQLGQMLSQFGLDPQQAMGGVAETLPEVVNQLTPKGQVEAGNLEQSLSDLLSKFG